MSASLIFFESFPYKVNPQTGYVDFDNLEEKALEYLFVLEHTSGNGIMLCLGKSQIRLEQH